MSDSVNSILYRYKSYYTAKLNLPDLTNQLSWFGDDVIRICRETKDTTAQIKESGSDVRRMYSVKHALSEIQYFVDKAYEFIDKVDDVPYYFQCTFDGESSWSDYKSCVTRFEKGQTCLRECLEIHEVLKRYCDDARRSCDAAERELTDKAESARKKKIAARATGAALTTAGVGTGVALSVVAGVFTFGIGTVVGLATTAGVATAAGVGSGVVGAAVGEFYNHSADKFRALSRNFSRLSQHAISLSELSHEMINSLGTINCHLQYHEAGQMVILLKRNGNYSYQRTSSKRSAVCDQKNLLSAAINSV